LVAISASRAKRSRMARVARLDGDAALEHRVITAEDPTETALADGLEDLIVAEAFHGEHPRSAFRS